MANNNGVIKNNNGTNGGNDQGQKVPEKKAIQKAFDSVQRGWYKFSSSKGGRWAIRITKAGLIGLGLKTAYDQGRKSVEPTVVYVTPVENHEEEPKEETKEEVTEETTAE